MSEFDQDHDDSRSQEFALEKSKTQVKRELQALRDLGRKLMNLPERDLLKLALPEQIHEAVIEAQSMSKGALKRQTGFIGGLLADSDHEAIEQRLTQLRQPHQGRVREFHQLETWRDGLLAGDDAVYDELIAEFEDFDIQHVRQLVRNAAREASQDKPPKSARQIFQYLKDLQQIQ